MAIVKAYKFSHPLLGPIAFIFISSYKNHGGYLRAESHVMFAGQPEKSYSEIIKFEHKPYEGGVVEVDEQAMSEIALEQAKSHIETYSNELPELRRELLSQASISIAEHQELFEAWVRQKFPQMHGIVSKSESEELRNFIRSFTNYPFIKVNPL